MTPGKTTYYHATTVDRLQSILSEGLDPSKWDDSRADEEPRPFIFLSHYISVAEGFAPLGEVGVVLAVTPPRELTRRFVFNLGEFIRVPFIIPPEYIAVHHFTFGPLDRDSD